MSGVQYYWFVAIGLLVGLTIGVINGVTGPIRTDDPLIVIPLLAASLHTLVATLIVLLEIWDRFGLGAAIAAVIVSPAIIIYWLSRINGIPERSTAPDR